MAGYEEYLARFRDLLAGAVVAETPGSGGAARVFTVRRPGHGAVGGAELAFVGGGLGCALVRADAGLGHNGVVSLRGVDPGALAAAEPAELWAWFLPSIWDPDLAREALLDLERREILAGADEDEPRFAAFRDALDRLDAEVPSETSVHDALAAVPFAAGTFPGEGPAPRDAALLVAIVERFRAAWPSLQRAAE